VTEAVHKLKEIEADIIILDLWIKDDDPVEIDLKNDYKTISSNRNYQDILDDIISDIETYTGMTLGELLETIE
jgi:hypothetical protein